VKRSEEIAATMCCFSQCDKIGRLATERRRRKFGSGVARFYVANQLSAPRVVLYLAVWLFVGAALGVKIGFVHDEGFVLGAAHGMGSAAAFLVLRIAVFAWMRRPLRPGER
jgi:hypothetical protein